MRPFGKRSPSESAQYRERVRVQCLQWAMGSPRHNHTDDECTPDFGCCCPDLLLPIDERWSVYRKEFGSKDAEQASGPTTSQRGA